MRSWIAAVGNFSVQYNLGVAGVVHQIMKSHDDAVGPQTTPDYPEPDWLKYSLLGVVFVGNVIGMVSFGRYVDQVGPRKAMLTTLGFVLAGSVGSALLPFGSPSMIYFIICCCRFILGIGVGGIYPVGAVTASETPSTDTKELANRIGKAFIWQMPGAITPYIVASMLLRMEAYPGITAFQFRFLFFLGAVPAAAVFLLTYLQPVEAAPAPSPVSRLPGSIGNNSSASDAQRSGVLFGTASAWFLFDVVFYGTVIFLPTITEKIFANDQATLLEMTNFSLCLICMMIPGAVLTVVALKYVPAKMVCVIGFWGMGFTYLIVSILDPLLSGSTGFVMFLLFGTNLMAVNFGPNVCTYILPMLYFPRDVRGKYHGISAALGKAGAAVGTFMLKKNVQFRMKNHKIRINIQ